MPNPTIATGVYWVTVVCPQCKVDELVPVSLMPRLVRTPEEATLGVKVGQKAAAHRCGQTSITVVSVVAVDQHATQARCLQCGWVGPDRSGDPHAAGLVIDDVDWHLQVVRGTA